MNTLSDKTIKVGDMVLCPSFKPHAVGWVDAILTEGDLLAVRFGDDDTGELVWFGRDQLKFYGRPSDGR